MTTGAGGSTGQVSVRGRQDHSRTGPLLEGRRVRLEPLSRRHLPALYAILSQPEMADEWPLRGNAVTADAIEETLWRLSDRQYAIVSRREGEVVGLVQAVNDDELHGTAGISIFLAPRMWRSGWPLEALVLFIQLMFEDGCRKLTCRMADAALERLAGGRALGLREEAVFRGHIGRGDGFEDLHALALDAETWDWPKIARWMRLPTGV